MLLVLKNVEFSFPKSTIKHPNNENFRTLGRNKTPSGVFPHSPSIITIAEIISNKMTNANSQSLNAFVALKC